MRDLMPEWGSNDLLRTRERVTIPERDKFNVSGESNVTIQEVEATAVERPIEPEVTSIVPTEGIAGDDQVDITTEGDVIYE